MNLPSTNELLALILLSILLLCCLFFIFLANYLGRYSIEQVRNANVGYFSNMERREEVKILMQLGTLIGGILSMLIFVVIITAFLARLFKAV